MYTHDACMEVCVCVCVCARVCVHACVCACVCDNALYSSLTSSSGSRSSTSSTVDVVHDICNNCTQLIEGYVSSTCYVVPRKNNHSHNVHTHIIIYTYYIILAQTHTIIILFTSRE